MILTSEEQFYIGVLFGNLGYNTCEVGIVSNRGYRIVSGVSPILIGDRVIPAEVECLVILYGDGSIVITYPNEDIPLEDG